MRKRHRWIDKRRHRQARMMMSPREFVHLYNTLITDAGGWVKVIERESKAIGRIVGRITART